MWDWGGTGTCGKALEFRGGNREEQESGQARVQPGRTKSPWCPRSSEATAKAQEEERSVAVPDAGFGRSEELLVSRCQRKPQVSGENQVVSPPLCLVLQHHKSDPVYLVRDFGFQPLVWSLRTGEAERPAGSLGAKAASSGQGTAAPLLARCRKDTAVVVAGELRWWTSHRAPRPEEPQDLSSACGGSCGLRPMVSHYGTSRVVGGTAAQPGAWPWIVSIQGPQGHVCGGSLISPEHITMWHVVIGATQLTRPGPEAQVRYVKQLVVHEHYSNITESNDIALLELDQPVQCGPSVQLACVPDASLRVPRLTTCYVSGWGATTARSDVLQEAQVHLIDVNVCNSSGWYHGAIHSHNLCAGYPQGGIDTCQGDSGGPLVCKDDNADYFWLVGVTSWGKGCARARRPGVYTSTQHFYDWILVQMGLRPAATAPPTPRPFFTSTPFPRPRPTPTPSSSFMPCPFPVQKLVEFFKLLQELLQVLRGTLA
ncbi:acrosin-like [Rhynochetos jubatus]